MTREQITTLANSLSNHDFCELFNHFTNRCHVFSGTLGRRCITSEVTAAFLNGSTIQINTESADLECMADDDYLRGAIEEWAREAEL